MFTEVHKKNHVEMEKTPEEEQNLLVAVGEKPQYTPLQKGRGKRMYFDGIVRQQHTFNVYFNAIRCIEWTREAKPNGRANPLGRVAVHPHTSYSVKRGLYDNHLRRCLTTFCFDQI